MFEGRDNIQLAILVFLILKYFLDGYFLISLHVGALAVIVVLPHKLCRMFPIPLIFLSCTYFPILSYFYLYYYFRFHFPIFLFAFLFEHYPLII